MRSADLAQVLRALPLPVDPNVIIGLSPADDAAVVRLRDDLALVFTTDFFTPVVDDPVDFGRIAATNAISDVYAMGAMPLVALNIVAFPTKNLGVEILGEVLRGGAEIARLAGISIAGGHSVEDQEPKYGLAVIGTVRPEDVWRKGGARAGDGLLLTKALGTGVLATALKRERIVETDAAMVGAVRSMTTLNARAAELTRREKITVHAATDVTGYGLVGHLGEMLRASEGVCAVLDARAFPALDGALDLAREGVLPGGSRANRAAAAEWLTVTPDADDARVWLACDAQTSGGLLIACPMAECLALRDVMRAEGIPAAVVGEIESGDGARVTIR